MSPDIRKFKGTTLPTLQGSTCYTETDDKINETLMCSSRCQTKYRQCIFSHCSSICSV